MPAKKSQYQRDLARIHIAKKELGLDGRAYRAVIDGIMARRGLKGRASSANLDAEGRRELLKTFKDMGWQPDPPPGQDAPARQDDDRAAHRAMGKPKGRYPAKGSAGQNGRLTTSQADFIAYLEDQLAWTPNPKRLRGFIERTLGQKSSVSMLTNRQASSVISGLKKMADTHPSQR